MFKTNNLFFLVILFLGLILRCIYAYTGEIELGGGDSSARALLIFSSYLTEFKLFISTIWLPFYFFLYSLPLNFFYGANSLIYFQLMISIITLFSFVCLTKLENDPIQKALVIFLISIMPAQLGMVSSVLSELPFLMFILLAVNFYNTKNNYALALSCLCLLAATMIRFEGWFLYIVFLAFDFLKYKSPYRTLFLALPFLCVMGIYDIVQFKHTKIHFAGLVTNGDESSYVNIRNGYDSFFLRLQALIKIILSEGGLFYLLIPVGVYKALKTKSLSLMDSMAIISLSLLIEYNYQNLPLE